LRSLIKTLSNEKFTFLLAFLLVYALAAPFFEQIVALDFFMDISLSAVMLSAVFTVYQKKGSRIIILLLVLPSLLIIWVRFFVVTEQILFAAAVSQVFFNAYMIFIIIYYIFETGLVTRNIIAAALIAYLFIGLLGANLYLLVELIYPGSFSIPHETILKDPSVFKYFSFVTLTTLGYGDISPISSQARSLSVLEALIGQIYLAVLIARLVGYKSTGSVQENK